MNSRELRTTFDASVNISTTVSLTASEAIRSLKPQPPKEMERTDKEDQLLARQRQREEALLYAWVEQAHREGLERERDKAERRARRAEKRAAKAAKKTKHEEKKKKKAKRRGTQHNSSILGLSFLESLSLEVFGRRVEW